MKKIFLFIYFFSHFGHEKIFAQAGEWVWIHGSSSPNSTGNYGTQGVPSPANTPDGLYEPCEWTDLNGNFWFYGGDRGGNVDDLWKYDPVTNEWTWMRGTHSNSLGNYGTQGVSSPTNRPPARARGSASWVDLNGNLWFFGGGSGPNYSDLWKYDISVNEWTWIKGPNTANVPGVYGTLGVASPANNPGARREVAAAWTDNAGDLWMFGGYLDAGLATYNDLWKYNIASNQWTWMKGSSIAGQPGIYGTLGVESPSNTPGARMSYCRWKDFNGNFWLFGGGNWNTQVHYNDLWRFNPATNNWTWMSGSNTGNATGSFGTKCVADLSNVPRASFENRVAWTDPFSNLWMFGGTLGSGTHPSEYNDLWCYCILANQWIWVSGDNTNNAPGNWGTLGVSSPLNKPNGRGGTIGWINNSSLYLFGGWDQYNDLWKYTIDYSCVVCTQTLNAAFVANNFLCPGTCTGFLNLSTYANSYQWNFPGASPNTSTDVNPTPICYNSPGTYDVQLISSNANGSDTLLIPNYITVFPSPPPQAITQNGDTLTANAGAVSYQWYYNGNIIPGATNYFYVASQSGDYNVVATDTNGCEVEAVIYDVLAYVQSVSGKEQLAIFPNPVYETLTVIGYPLIGTANEISVSNMLGEMVLSVQVPTTPRDKLPSVLDVRALHSGLYILEVTGINKTFRIKFVKE